MDFALGLRDYDLSLMQPHFPGYPVYIFISWLFFKLFHNEVWALVAPGVFFGSLTVYPLSFLVRQLFSERVAILTAILYIINPLCWLQAERPTSDAMGLFFIMLSTYFLYRVFAQNTQEIQTTTEGSNCNMPRHVKSNRIRPDLLFRNFKSSSYNPPVYGRIQGGESRRPILLFRSFNINVWCSNRKCLFLGSLTLGFGFGVRLSYFPFIALWMGILFYLATKRTHCKKHDILYGLIGLFAGVFFWFFPQIGYTGWRPYFQNGLSFSYGHFTDWGGSVITFGGLERIVCLAKSTWVYGLGGWWYDASFLRLIPSMIIVIPPFYFLKHYHFDRRELFLGLYVIPYLLWIVFGQNVANPRHIMPIIPIILIMIAYGLCKAHDKGYKVVSLFFMLALIVSMSAMSFKLVTQYHNNAPAPLQLIQFIERQYNNISTRIYCSDEKRFFDYYAPAWDVRKVRDRAELNIDLNSSLGKPQDILLVHTPEEIKQFGIIRPPIIKFEGNAYMGSTRKVLMLYALTGF
ncbi:MAG: glycosyltransferase family 39 protein [Candidatus Brocadia sp.]